MANPIRTRPLAVAASSLTAVPAFATRARRVLVLCLAALLGAGAAAGAPSAIPLKVAYDGYSMTTGPLNYALQKGIFKKYGLDLSLSYVDAGTTLTQAVVGGSVDIGQNGYSPAAAAAVQGADLVFIGGISNKLPFQLVVRKGINSAAELKGKNIAISRYGSSTDVAARIAVKHLGLKDSDVVYLQLGGEGTRTAAMMTGQVDASMEQYPRTAELKEQGFQVLVDCTGVAGDFPNTSYVTTRAFLKKNPEAVKRFLMAVSEGIHEFKKNPDEAIRLTVEFLKAKPGPAMTETYQRYSKDIYPDVPLPSIKGIGMVLEDLKKKNPAAGSFRPEQLVDTSILDQLQKEGFFAKLK